MLKSLLLDSSIKKQPIKEVFRVISRYGPITRSKLSNKLEIKIKQTALARIISELKTNNLIKEGGHEESEGGRPPVLYSIVPTAGFIIAVHIIRAHTKVVLLDSCLHTVKNETFVMTTKHTPEIVIAKVIEITNKFLNEYKIELDQLLGIGISSVGPLNKKDGIIIKPQLFLSKGWINVPIVKIIKEIFPVKVILEHSSNAGLMGEYVSSSLPHENMLYIFNSWGTGCGIMTNGEIINSRIGRTDGFAHMSMDVNGPICFCGSRGCLNTYTSLNSILESLNNSNPYFKSINWSELSTLEIIERLKDEYELTNEIVLRSATYLGVGISNLVNIIGSEAVYISGPLIYHYPNYYETVIKSISQRVYGKPNIALSQGDYEEETLDIGLGALVYASYY
ncbi:ROK family protein [Alkalihalobacillus deserti]|uniref:ROK family protein n=1 Tax=Alkalihalobacillus deserti TaxID=2879466 RepID=UPI001D1585E4|nr:ROK family protein [Alkalihalobacillus deserti]